MNINELILEFIDGSSTPEMDKSLFNELANNEVAQQKLKKFIEIENSFVTGNSYFQPSAESVNQVFTQLGFKKTGLFGALPFLQSNFIRYSVPAVMTTLMFVFTYNYFFNDDDKNNLTNSKNNLATFTSPQINNVIETNKNNDLNNGMDKNNKLAKINKNNLNNNSNNIVKYIYKEKFVAVGNNGNMQYFDNKDDLKEYFDSNLKNETPEKSKFSFQNVIEINESDIFENSLSITNLNNYTLNDFENKEYNNLSLKEISNLEFTLNFSPTFDLKSSTMNPEKLSSFNQLGFNALYKVTDKFKLGLEIQQETFLQKFEEDDEFNRTLIYTQRPNFTNIGAVVKYNILDKIFVYTSVGTNTEFSGVYNRVRLGREFYNIFPLDFDAGIEHSALHYSFNNDKYSSFKFGIFFGVKF